MAITSGGAAGASHIQDESQRGCYVEAARIGRRLAEWLAVSVYRGSGRTSGNRRGRRRKRRVHKKFDNNGRRVVAARWWWRLRISVLRLEATVSGDGRPRNDEVSTKISGLPCRRRSAEIAEGTRCDRRNREFLALISCEGAEDTSRSPPVEELVRSVLVGPGRGMGRDNAGGSCRLRARQR